MYTHAADIVKIVTLLYWKCTRKYSRVHPWDK